jgi:hypothetical protein
VIHLALWIASVLVLTAVALVLGYVAFLFLALLVMALGMALTQGIGERPKFFSREAWRIQRSPFSKRTTAIVGWILLLVLLGDWAYVVITSYRPP